MKVIKHGLMWFFQDNEVGCPECENTEIGDFECMSGRVYIKQEYDGESVWVDCVHCKCCGCLFEPFGKEEN